MIFTQIRFLIKINLIGGSLLSIKFQCYDINLVWLQHNLVIDVFFFYLRWKRSGFISDQEENINRKNSNSPRFTQLTSQTRGLNSEKVDICKEEQASCEWTEYADFPSSENLSTFPAGMEMGALNKAIEQSQPIINSKISSMREVRGEDTRCSEIVTSHSVSFSDVVCGFGQEDYTELVTIFPSSEEDLDAFLKLIGSSIAKIYCRKHRWRLMMLLGRLTRLNFN